MSDERLVRLGYGGVHQSLRGFTGRGRQQGSKADFRRFVLIALGSADETLLWRRFAKDLGYLTDAQFDDLHAKFGEVARMLNGLAASLRTDT